MRTKCGFAAVDRDAPRVADNTTAFASRAAGVSTARRSALGPRSAGALPRARDSWVFRSERKEKHNNQIKKKNKRKTKKKKKKKKKQKIKKKKEKKKKKKNTHN